MAGEAFARAGRTAGGPALELSSCPRLARTSAGPANATKPAWAQTSAAVIGRRRRPLTAAADGGRNAHDEGADAAGTVRDDGAAPAEPLPSGAITKEKQFVLTSGCVVYVPRVWLACAAPPLCDRCAAREREEAHGGKRSPSGHGDSALRERERQLRAAPKIFCFVCS